MAERPVLAAYATGSGRRLWSFPVEDAGGDGVDLSGGWSFGTAGELLLGHIAPARRGRSLSAYGFFALRLADGSPVGAVLENILERACGAPRAALLLVWGALEDRLRAAYPAPDGLQSARELAERGRLPRQFVDAYASFRSLRNDLARAGDGETSDDVLWSLVDIGGELLALAPEPRETSDYQGASE